MSPDTKYGKENKKQERKLGLILIYHLLLKMERNPDLLFVGNTLFHKYSIQLFRSFRTAYNLIWRKVYIPRHNNALLLSSSSCTKATLCLIPNISTTTTFPNVRHCILLCGWFMDGLLSWRKDKSYFTLLYLNTKQTKYLEWEISLSQQLTNKYFLPPDFLCLFQSSHVIKLVSLHWNKTSFPFPLTSFLQMMFVENTTKFEIKCTTYSVPAQRTNFWFMLTVCH